MARVANVFKAQPVGQHHHHAGGRGLGLARVHAHGAVQRHAGQHGFDGAGLVVDDALEMRFKLAVFAQQVVEVAVQKPVFPDALKQRVHEKPGVFHITHAFAGAQQLAQRFFIALQQGVDQLVFGRVVVVQVARADPQLGRYQRGRNIGLAKAVEQRQRHLENALRSAARRFFRHRLAFLTLVSEGTLTQAARPGN